MSRTTRIGQPLVPLAGVTMGLCAGLFVVDLAAAPVALTLSSPRPGSVARGTVQLSAYADAPGLVALQFTVSAAPAGPRITAGACSTAWDTTAFSDGTYTVSAIGTDESGAPVQAAPVAVIVANHSGQLSPRVDQVAATSAVVQWTTGAAATGRVEYGTSPAYGSEARERWGPLTTHTVRLSGLAPSTAYHFRVISTTSDGAVLTSFDGVFITGAASTPSTQAARTPVRKDEVDPDGVGATRRTPVPAGSDYPIQLSATRASAMILAADRGLDHIPGEVLVRFRPGVTAAGQQRALMALRSRPSVDALQWRGDVAVLRDAAQPDARILAAQLREQPEVQYAEPNYLLRLRPRRADRPRAPARGATAATPNDTAFGDQWNFTAIDLPRAWDIQPGGRPDLIVAVLDTGVTTVNQSFTFPLWTGAAIEDVSLPYAVSPDLSGSRLVSPRDFVFGAPGGAVLDMDGHGTHVASVIAEDTNNAFALAGVAYNVRIMPVKVCLSYWDIQIAMSAAGVPGFTPPGLSFCPSDALAQGIRYAVDNGARVINVSIGGPGQSLTIRDAVVYAVSRGAFVAISNGNEFEDGNVVNYPAADAASIDGAMSVAATRRSSERAGYSNTGSHTEIAAPGGDFDRDGLDGLIWQVTLHPDAVDSFVVIIPAFDEFAEVGYEGTSSAAPHVAGVAALIMSQGITNPAVVEQILAASARDLGTAGRDDQFGYGLLQARAALFGFGIRR